MSKNEISTARKTEILSQYFGKLSIDQGGNGKRSHAQLQTQINLGNGEAYCGGGNFGDTVDESINGLFNDVVQFVSDKAFGINRKLYYGFDDNMNPIEITPEQFDALPEEARLPELTPLTGGTIDGF